MERRFSRALVLALAASLVLAAGCGPAPVRTRGAAYVLPRSAKGEGNTRFVMFDIGQADATLVLHDGRSMLIDAGVSRYRRAGEPSIAELLRRELPSFSVDTLVVTHYHADHIGSPADKESGSSSGLWELFADGFKVGTIVDRGDAVYGKTGDTQEAYLSWLPRWIAAGQIGERRIAKTGDVLELGRDLRVEIVAADGSGVIDEQLRRDPQAFDRIAPSENDLSIALKFTQGDFELFNGGDLTGVSVKTDYGEAYNDIESSVAGRVGDVEVYKVDHHGSNHSSNPCFVRVLDPEVSVFTTGTNRYRHPSPRVFRALSERGDVRVTGGADSRVLAEEPAIRDVIVGGNVEVVVAPSGGKFWVNGRYYRAKTTEQERDRSDFLGACHDDDEADTRQE